jgi:hypothetical protein
LAAAEGCVTSSDFETFDVKLFGAHSSRAQAAWPAFEHRAVGDGA